MNLKYKLLCEALSGEDDTIGQFAQAEPEEDDSGDRILPDYMKSDVQPEPEEKINYRGTPVVFSDRPHGIENPKQAY